MRLPIMIAALALTCCAGESTGSCPVPAPECPAPWQAQDYPLGSQVSTAMRQVFTCTRLANGMGCLAQFQPADTSGAWSYVGQLPEGCP